MPSSVEVLGQLGERILVGRPELLQGKSSGVRQSRALEVGEGELDSCEIDSRELCAPQARVLEVRPSEMRIGQVGLVQCRGLEICTLQVSAQQVGTL